MKRKDRGMAKGVEGAGGQSRGQGNVAPPFSPAVRAGDFVFVSGRAAFEAKIEIAAVACRPHAS